MWNLKSCNSVHERYLREKENERQWKSLVTMKPMLDNRRPKTMSHRPSRAKQKRMQADKDEKIRYDNNILLKKMLYIDLKPSALHPLQLLPRIPTTGTLHKGYRVQQLSRINLENKVVCIVGDL